jgi:beta-lactamase regulating signal transducer with metallopeptidase domain/protocatechuate 3,4-dioxygenase beta subunit
LDWTLVAAIIAPVLASTEGPWKLPLRWLPAEPAAAGTITIPSAPLAATPVLANPVPAAYEHETGVVRTVNPALRGPTGKPWNWPDWRDVILAIEALAIVLLAAKWLLSALALACLSCRSRAVDAKLVARIDEQLPARLRPSATIRLDRNVSTPCVFGLFRPCILLPEFLARAERTQQMIFALAHESSHLLRGDLWSWRRVRLAQFALWFQPAYWWLRRQTRLCQDFLADFDATMVGKPADLADFLVQLARMQQSRQTVPALAMRSDRKDLFRRINMLLGSHSQLENRCPRRFQASMALAVFSIIGLAAVLRLEAQDQTTESKPKESQALAIHASKPNPGATEVRGRVLGPDGKPVSGAKLYLGAVSIWNDGRRQFCSFGHEETKSAVRATSGADGHFGFTFSNTELMAMEHGELMRSGIRDLEGEVMAVAPGHGCGWAEINRPAGELTIHLVDDVPVEGRVLDSDGHPIAGATIRVVGIGISPPEGLNTLFTALKAKGIAFGQVWTGSLPNQPAIMTTSRDGRFRLTGIGRDRLVQIYIEAPTIASTFAMVMTRTGEGVKALNGQMTFFPAFFDFIGQPSRLITGTVRNKTTGKPMAGVSVNLGGGGSLIKGLTDQNGHYELRGVHKGPTYRLVATPADGLFFKRQVTLEDTPGLDSLTCDIELVSGLTVRGRVTEKDTGKPVMGAQVDYHPLGGNSYVNKLLPGRWKPSSEATAGPDGSYMLTVMPGPGVIGVKGPKLNDHAPAVSTVKEREQFFKTPVVVKTGFAMNNHDNFLTSMGGRGSYGGISVDSYNALVLIEPGAEERAIVRDVSLERPQELRGRVLGPDGQPLAGTTVYGLENQGVETLKGSEFTVRGVNPKGKRSLLFYHKDKQLGYYLKELDTASAEPLTVKLERCGSASGRIIDEDGQPVAGTDVDVISTWSRDHPRVVTDANGRFHVTGLVARQEYYVEELGNGPTSRFDARLTVEPGQHKDLGDIKMTEPEK